MVEGTYGKYLYPISFMIEKSLAALTLLQFPSIDAKHLKKARNVINGMYEFPVEDIMSMDGNAMISVKDVLSDYLNRFADDRMKGIKEYSNGYLFEKVKINGAVLSSKEMTDFLSEYVPLATTRIIFSCDLVYLLKAYVENCDRIKNDIDRLIILAEEAKAVRCTKALKEYAQSGIMHIETVQCANDEASVDELINEVRNRKIDGN